MAHSSDNSATRLGVSLLEEVSSLNDGWNIDHLKLVRSKAESLKSNKSAVSIGAMAQKAILARTQGVGPISLAQRLFDLNPSTKLIRDNKNYIVVESPANFRLPRLPLGYGYKGGAARVALLHVLGVDTRGLQVRDFDLVRYAQGSIQQDNEIAARWMPDDFRYGYGVEVVKSLDLYFSSRDLTINEVLLTGKKIIFTHRAFDDLQAGVIRASAHLGNSLEGLPGKIACKMLRFLAEFKCAGVPCELVGFPKGLEVSARDVKLHGVRAAQQSPEIEKVYFALCSENLKIIGTVLAADINPASKSNQIDSASSPLRSGIRKPRRQI